MILKNRTIFSDNGTLIDLTKDLDKFTSGVGAIPMVAGEDYLYFGGVLPFNHRFFAFDTPASVVSATTQCEIEIWNGTSWVSVVDIIDQTSVSDITMKQDGIISWTTDREEAWICVLDAKDDIPEFASSTFNVYNHYWARLSFTDDLGPTTALKFVGQKFSDDTDLGTWYPDLVLSNVLTAWESGKTNWDEQHVEAAKQIATDLMQRQSVVSANQILNFDRFREASVHYVASMAYRGFGDDYKDNYSRALADYKSLIGQAVLDIDKNQTARIEPTEAKISAEILRR